MTHGAPLASRQSDAVLETGLGQAADIDEGAAGQADIGRNRQREVQFGRLGPDEPPAQRVAGDRIVRAGAADLEAAQVVATQEEPVDDLLLLALVEQVADARRSARCPSRCCR